MRFLSDIKSIQNAIHIEILSDYEAWGRFINRLTMI